MSAAQDIIKPMMNTAPSAPRDALLVLKLQTNVRPAQIRGMEYLNVPVDLEHLKTQIRLNVNAFQDIIK